MKLHALHLICLRHGRDIRRALGYLIAAVLLGLTGYGAWWSMTHYITAAAQIAEAKANERQALALLEGRAQEKFIGDQYIIITTFERKEQILQRTP